MLGRKYGKAGKKRGRKKFAYEKVKISGKRMNGVKIVVRRFEMFG